MARILDFADGFESSTEPTSVPFPASQVEVTPTGNIASDNAQDALVEIQGDVDTINAKIGNANGIASLDSGGKIPAAQIPAVAIIDVYSVANIAARDALTVQEGDVAVVADAGSGVSKSYIYDGASWIELLADGSLAAHQASSSAHAASAITNTPSGNLVATNVQSALNELQTELDGKLTDGSNIITNSKLATVATQTIKGRTTAGTGNVEDLTTTQVTAMLNAVVGDSGSGGTKGLVPAPASGDASKFFKGDGTWSALPAAPNLSVVSKTSAYTATTSDDVINLDASGGAFTLTLYNPSGNTGKQLILTKTDSSTNYVTLGSYNINGATRKLCTKDESVTIYSDGTAWRVRNHNNVLPYESFTPTGSWNTNVTYNGQWRRIGPELHVRARVLCSGAPNAAGNLTFNLPSGFTIDTTKFADNTINQVEPIGSAMAIDNGTQEYPGHVVYWSTSAVGVQPYKVDGTYAVSPATYNYILPITFGNNDSVTVNFTVPIVDWW